VQRRPAVPSATWKQSYRLQESLCLALFADKGAVLAAILEDRLRGTPRSARAVPPLLVMAWSAITAALCADELVCFGGKQTAGHVMLVCPQNGGAVLTAAQTAGAGRSIAGQRPRQLQQGP
jgi:hypothetical protein